MKKQMISLCMAIIMVLSMLPMSAFAEEKPDVPAELPTVTEPLPPVDAPDETTPSAETAPPTEDLPPADIEVSSDPAVE